MNLSMIITATMTMLLSLSPLAFAQAPPAKRAQSPRVRSRRVVDPSWEPRQGATGNIFSSAGCAEVYAASSWSYYDDLVQSLKARDFTGLKGLVERDLVYSVPIGVPVLVLEPHPELAEGGRPMPVEVRILEGTFKDKRAWVPGIWLARLVEVPVRLTPTQQAKEKAAALAAQRAVKAKAKEEAKAKVKPTEAEAEKPPAPERPRRPAPAGDAGGGNK